MLGKAFESKFSVEENVCRDSEGACCQEELTGGKL
jgi:hypothetical protein